MVPFTRMITEHISTIPYACSMYVCLYGMNGSKYICVHVCMPFLYVCVCRIQCMQVCLYAVCMYSMYVVYVCMLVITFLFSLSQDSSTVRKFPLWKTKQEEDVEALNNEVHFFSKIF